VDVLFLIPILWSDEVIVNSHLIEQGLGGLIAVGLLHDFITRFAKELGVENFK